MTFLRDLPDHFHPAVSHSSRDWASDEGQLRWLTTRAVTPLAVEETRIIDVYTVPAGRKLYWSGCCVSSNIRINRIFDFIPIGLSSQGWYNPYESYPFTVEPVIIIPAGTIIRVSITNEDIVAGSFLSQIFTYETPA